MNTWGYCGTCQRDYRHVEGCACKRVGLDVPMDLPAVTPQDLQMLMKETARLAKPVDAAKDDVRQPKREPAKPATGDDLKIYEAIAAGYPKQEPDDIKQPDHYTSGGIETIDYIAAKMGVDEFKGYLRGNVMKYVSRAGLKDDTAKDLKKAQVYLGWLVKVTETGRHK